MSFFSNHPKATVGALAALTFGAGFGTAKLTEGLSAEKEPTPITAAEDPSRSASPGRSFTQPRRLADAIAIDLESLTSPAQRGYPKESGPKLELTILPGEDGKLERLTLGVGAAYDNWQLEMFKGRDHLATFEGKNFPNGSQVGSLVSLELPEPANNLQPKDLSFIVRYEQGGKVNTRGIGEAEIQSSQQVKRYELEHANFFAGDQEAPPCEVHIRIGEKDELRYLSFQKTVKGVEFTGGSFEILGVANGTSPGPRTITLASQDFEFSNADAVGFKVGELASRRIFSDYEPQIVCRLTQKLSDGSERTVGPIVLAPFEGAK